MKLTEIFNSDYSKFFNESTKDIPLLFLLNILCVPLSMLLIFFRFTPTTITNLSNISRLLAVLSLIFVEDPLVFPIFWLLGLFLDISDGMVARKTKQTSASGSFYDHMSDQVAFIFLFLACGIKYSDPTIWILTFITSTFFLFMTVINQTLAHRKFRFSIYANEEDTEQQTSPNTNNPNLLRSFFLKNPALKKLLQFIRNNLFLMQGNCVLYLLPLSFGKDLAAYSLILFVFITSYNVVNRIIENVRINLMLTAGKISWK